VGSSTAAAGEAVARAAPKRSRTTFATRTPDPAVRKVLADAARVWTASRWMVLMLFPQLRYCCAVRMTEVTHRC